jgi:hypothetical protein
MPHISHVARGLAPENCPVTKECLIRPIGGKPPRYMKDKLMTPLTDTPWT